MEAKNNKTSLVLYGNLLSDIKTRIRQAQVKATLSANSEMILMYWDIGRMIQERQDHEGWGTAVIPRLARDIRNELPEEKGFSERNIKRMLRFYREYPNILPIMPQAVDQLPVNEHSVILQRLVAQIPWGHNILLMERVKDLSSRFWYMEQTIQNGWSRDTLGLMIKSGAHLRHGKAVSNFSLTLPDRQDTAGMRCLHGKLK
ncbi:MAG: DUF1016 N-terminal domain-containing protein [Desulfobacteria bacterium]